MMNGSFLVHSQCTQCGTVGGCFEFAGKNYVKRMLMGLLRWKSKLPTVHHLFMFSVFRFIRGDYSGFRLGSRTSEVDFFLHVVGTRGSNGRTKSGAKGRQASWSAF